MADITDEVFVTLTYPELRVAMYGGCDRHVRALAAGRIPMNGIDPDNWHAHIVGCQGESAMAKYLGVFWVADLGRPYRDDPDVGGYHVRTNGPSLIIKKKDPADVPYVLVLPVSGPKFRIGGWCWGYEGKKDEYMRPDPEGNGTNRACYMVNPNDLHPIAEPPPGYPIYTTGTGS